MHDRQYNDRSLSYVPQSPKQFGAFPTGGMTLGYFRAMFADVAMLMVLLVATVGALIAIQSPLGHGRFSLRGQSEAFTKTFSAVLVRDKAWFDQQKVRLTYFQEQHMSFSQLMNRWQPQIAEASQKFQLPAAWIRAVIRMESGGRTMSSENRPITSPVGAVGLMQLMPGTYEEMRQQHKLGADPFNPRDNIMAGAAYLHWLHKKYGFPAMFVAYNDGPGNLEAKRSKGRALPAETQNYVAKICAELGAPLPAASKAKRSLAKFTRPNGKPVWIDKTAIASIRRALPGEYARSVKTVITIGKVKQGVRESVTAARAAIRVHARYG
jgi:hypothetical protein